jgi:multisubunit Na+/H+ antiporter MnhC subunit
MIDNLPFYITLIFAVTTFAAIGFFLLTARQTGSNDALNPILSLTFLILLVVHGAASLSGFFMVTNTLPPRFVLAPLPTTLILLAIVFFFARKSFSISTLQTLTLLHIIRVPVELCLHWLYQSGQIPQLMTFEGRNFDILSGLTAPFVAAWAFRGEKANKPVLIIWNLLALGLLINIVAHAILSLETPFQQLAFDQPNRAVLYFPFIWLPAIVVPIVFVSHVWSLWQLLTNKKL